jgi:hypothetical protein
VVKNTNYVNVLLCHSLHPWVTGSYYLHYFLLKHHQFLSSVLVTDKVSHTHTHTHIHFLTQQKFLNRPQNYTPRIYSVLLLSVVLAQSEQRLGYGVDDWGSIPGRGNDGNFSVPHRVLTVSGVKPASCQMSTGGSYIAGKAAGAWSWPLAFI